jgi:hypothetical protein
VVFRANSDMQYSGVAQVRTRIQSRDKCTRCGHGCESLNEGEKVHGMCTSDSLQNRDKCARCKHEQGSLE